MATTTKRKTTKAASAPQPFKIFFLCDRRKCDQCNTGCSHTGDISHAVHFEKKGEDYWEKEAK